MTPSISADFPILSREDKGQRLVYLDSAATTQKPQVVIDAVANYYKNNNANVHRAAHTLADEATQMLEAARSSAQNFINAKNASEIIFTRGTTESINLVANGLTAFVQNNDEILITELEHHSNIVPWQQLAQRSGAKIVAVAVTPNGDLDQQDFVSKLSKRTRVFAGNHVSNALGTINPIHEMIQTAKSAGAITVIDGAQAALHESIDVQLLDCDFYAFSGHKMYAPTGIGVLYGKQEWLEKIPPWQGGGEMIETVTIQNSTYQKPPYKFEAGTPNIGGAVGLHAAITYLESIPHAQLVDAEDNLIARTQSGLQQIPGVTLIGQAQHKRAVVSFLVDGAHPNDIGTLLNQQGVAVRTGHHCTMPLMQALQIPGTVRASFSLYSTQDDVERLLNAVQKATTFI